MSPDKMLARPVMAIWAALVLIPIAFNFGSEYEGDVFPVVDDVHVVTSSSIGGAVAIYVAFHKRRQCEYLGLNWYKGPRRLIIDFQPGSDLAPQSRPVGDQLAGPWVVHGVSTLEGTHASVVHRCHPLWLTYTNFYP